MTDLTVLSDADLATLRADVAREIDARSVLAGADRMTADLAARVATARKGRPARPPASKPPTRGAT